MKADKFGACHKKAYASQRLRKHAIVLREGRGCTRNLTDSKEKRKICGLYHEPGSAEPFIESECAMFLIPLTRSFPACNVIMTG